MDDALVEARTVALLRRVGDSPVPLPRLYDDVVRELGPVVSGPDQLRERLRERPERFIVLDPPGDPAWTEAWPDEVRRRYAAALRQTALSPEPRVTLAPDADALASADAVPDRLDASIRALAGAAATDPTVTEALAEALAESAALREALTAADESST